MRAKRSVTLSKVAQTREVRPTVERPCLLLPWLAACLRSNCHYFEGDQGCAYHGKAGLTVPGPGEVGEDGGD